MSCTFDLVAVRVYPGEQAQAFIAAFSEELEKSGYLYEDVDLSDAAELFIEDEEGFYFETDAEPLFAEYAEGAQVLRLIQSAAAAAPKAEVWAEYLCTFDDCGDAVFATYSYADNKLTVVEKVSPAGEYLEYCDDCGADFDAVCSIADFDPSESYACPECGEALSYEMSIEQIEYTLEDGEWTETQHAGMVIGNGGWDGDDEGIDELIDEVVHDEEAGDWEEMDEFLAKYADEDGNLPF